MNPSARMDPSGMNPSARIHVKMTIKQEIYKSKLGKVEEKHTHIKTVLSKTIFKWLLVYLDFS